MVLHSYLSGVFDAIIDLCCGQRCCLGIVDGRNQSCCRHGRRDSYFALAADFGSGDGGVFLVENANSRRGEEISQDAFFVCSVDEFQVVVRHGRNDAGGAVGWSSDDTAAGGDYAPGTEPLYAFDAMVYQVYISMFF